MIDTILLDLDGTLLPMDQDEFVKVYFTSLTSKLSSYGYDPNSLINGIMSGTAAMIKNDGRCTNEEIFWKCFVKVLGEKILDVKPILDEYYNDDFRKCLSACQYTPEAKIIIDKLKEKGYTLILATNPIFPEIATSNRIRWAGLSPSDFELYTTYENMNYCKPNLEYYKNICQKVGRKAENCLMIGNDVDEDMIVKEIGMSVFLHTDCLINKHNRDISIYPRGNFKVLMQFIENDFIFL